MQSNVKALTYMNFESPDRKVMYCKVPGVAFVLFKSQKCHFCKEVEPIFHALSIKEPRIMWCIADVGVDKQIVMLSNNSTTPIQNVPKLILYHNGKPVANYKGSRNANAIMNFLNELLPQFSGPKSFAGPISNVSPTYVPQPQKPAMQQPQPQQTLPKQQIVDDNIGFVPKNVTPYNEPYKAYHKL